MARLSLASQQSFEPAARGRVALGDIGFSAWLAQAEPGESLIYHRGFLVVDTDRMLSKLAPEIRIELRRMGDAAMRAAELGLVHLVQARLATDRFAYIAIARPTAKAAAATHASRLFEAQAA